MGERKGRVLRANVSECGLVGIRHNARRRQRKRFFCGCESAGVFSLFDLWELIRDVECFNERIA
jgi:hypothetical protein